MPALALTEDLLCLEAADFSSFISGHQEPTLYGVTDGKAVGTFLEHKFRELLKTRYHFEEGNSANGMDFPDIDVDLKVTSIKQPQSSCPFKSARQKVFGLGYNLLVFVYDKVDDPQAHTANLRITNTIYVEKHRTGDFQMTRGLRQLLENKPNLEDLMAFMSDKNLPVDDIELHNIATEILSSPPEQGFLTISNALQWRLQYGRVIEVAGTQGGIRRIF